MKTAMQDTSVDAYRQLPVRTMKTQGDRIVEVVAAGSSDMSLREIARDYQRTYGVPLDISTASARCNNLIAAKRLERLETTRPCSQSRRNVHPVRIPQNNSKA